jgi:hypothetical protein
MALRIRPVNFESDRQEMLDLLQRNLTDLAHAARFDWFYRRNPAGRSYSWFAVDDATGCAVGVASLISRAIWLGSTIKICGQVGDFAIDKAFRSLGPAVQLQRTTFEPVDAGQFVFCYDCPPHDAGMSTFRRLSMRENCRMRRYTRLLRTERFMEKRLGGGAISHAASVAANAALRMTSGSSRVAGIEIAEYSARFGEEFAALDRRENAQNEIRGRRSAEDLNWMYRDNPLQKYEVLAARRSGALLAYIVYAVRGDDAHVMEIGGAVGPEIGAALLAAVCETVHYAHPNVQAVSALLSAANEWIKGFERAGFRPREEAERVVAYASKSTPWNAWLAHNPRWSFQFSDITA